MSVKEGKTLIMMPYSNRLIRHFYSPIFLDGTFTTDKKTIIHASIVTTSNTIILIGLVLCESEDSGSAYYLIERIASICKATFQQMKEQQYQVS